MIWFEKKLQFELEPTQRRNKNLAQQDSEYVRYLGMHMERDTMNSCLLRVLRNVRHTQTKRVAVSLSTTKCGAANEAGKQ